MQNHDLQPRDVFRELRREKQHPSGELSAVFDEFLALGEDRVRGNDSSCYNGTHANPMAWAKRICLPSVVMNSAAWSSRAIAQ
jgi:hypothetical protein